MIVKVVDNGVVKVTFSFEEWAVIRNEVMLTLMMERKVVESIIQCGFDNHHFRSDEEAT